MNKLMNEWMIMMPNCGYMWNHLWIDSIMNRILFPQSEVIAPAVNPKWCYFVAATQEKTNHQNNPVKRLHKFVLTFI